jgi:hypothetical protein
MAPRDGVARSHLTVPQNGACRQAKARTIAKELLEERRSSRAGRRASAAAGF